MNFDIDLVRLFQLRLVVARHGEMDCARWWNTNCVLGRKGQVLMSRGFPKTHHFSRARLVFEVARSRSSERFPAVPGCVTLWNLPARLEEMFDGRWAHWLEDPASWTAFIDGLDVIESDLISALRERNLLSPEQEAEVQKMRRSAEGRAVPLSGIRDVDDDTISLLAAGFSRGEIGKPAVPYARLGD